MDIPTVPGTWYTVASTTTCEITDTATGTPLGTADAGSYSFQAQGNLTTLSDDSALYSKSNFKHAPAALMALGRLGGGESASALPAGYLAAEFLESTGTQLMRLPTYFDTTKGYYAAYKPLSSSGHFSVFEAHSSYKSFWASPRPANSTTSWEAHGFGGYMGRYVFGEEFESWLNYKGDRKRKVVTASRDYTSDCPDVIMEKTTAQTLFSRCHARLRKFVITEHDKIQFEYVAAISPDGVPCLVDIIGKQPIYNVGSGAFIVGMTCKQTLKLAELPAGGGSLTVSLPTGYESDAGVQAALDTARANGWTLTIQTYPPEASASSATTFALRRIWVRRTQTENGAHVAADGTRWQVDWCVDMLTPDGSTPDAHGYELFRSQEAAVAYWELAPYVDPEAENLLTE